MLWIWIGLVLLLGAIGLVLVPPLRRALLTRPIFAAYCRLLPAMSETERVALEAGTVWWDGELFRGRPDWARLLAFPQPQLSAAEQSFLDHETEELCRLVSDWETAHLHHDLSPAAWQYVKDQGFLGLIIPQEYGGKGFSAYAHSQVVTKLATRNSAAVVSVMVPNSLGPAELLLHYGTEEQRRHYLPRLARGLEIPAFALTGPLAGSDAAAIPDVGVVCTGMWQGHEVLGMRVSWDKRYITLGPICTVLGLAFRLQDPDHLLGDEEDLGITCALVPSEHPGVHIGRRHQPLGAVFQNGPNWGRDVFMPLDFIIGGPAMAGQGWRMLMECLAAGRGISLPSLNTGMMKLTARAVGAYARVRVQFKTAIGRFEGVEEPLARIGGHLYMADAARVMTAGAIDQGEKPSVVSAIVKYHVTERARQVVNDGMDILGGKGICLGPQNFLGRLYQQLPINITVEGANILTRSLIIFGQGAIRCHPYVLAEMRAAQDADPARGLRAFDAACFSHIGFALANATRAFLMGVTGSHWVSVPAVAPETKRYYQQLTRFSAAFALVADVAMLVMGGDLKRREKLSARLGDVLSLLYLCSATLKRYEGEGRQAADAPLLHWAIRDAMFKAQGALEGVIANFPASFAATLLRRFIFPLGRPYVVPSDGLGHEVAALLIAPSATRDRLVAGSYVEQGNEEDPVCALELALAAMIEAEPIEARLQQARRSGALMARWGAALVEEALARGLLEAHEVALLRRRDALRDKVIRVDDFPPDFGLGDPLAHVRQGDCVNGCKEGPSPFKGEDRRGMGVCQPHPHPNPSLEEEGDGVMQLPRHVRSEGNPMADKPVYIVDGARTPLLKARNAPGPFAASDLATIAGRALLARQPFAAEALDEVILGCVTPAPDEVNIGRVVSLRMGCGHRVPAWTVMRNCASGMQALDSALANIRLGRSHLVLAGGVEALSRAPLFFSDGMVRWLAAWSTAKTLPQRLATLRRVRPAHFAPVVGLLKGLTDPIVGLLMGQTAENLAWRFGITREEMDAFALRSHQRLAAAHDAGHFAAELVPLVDERGTVFAHDDGLRRDSNIAHLAKLKPWFDKTYGRVTAGNSSQVSDGAAWLLLASEEALSRHGLQPLGMITDSQWAGLAPEQMGLGPVHAATPILQRHGLGLNDLDAWEINEAFAAQVIACQRAWQDASYCREQLGQDGPLGALDEARLNVDGGAVAMGHPVGASGARIVLHLLQVLRRSGGRRGMAAICIGGGQGGAMLVEALP